MSVETADREYDHLFPDFREKLATLTRRMYQLTKLEWHMVEGYRSQARQTWLYAQGRTRPGPIVTWKTEPTWHGCGLAADLCPVKDGKLWYGAPYHLWLLLKVTAYACGLSNPAWSKGDMGHCQLSGRNVLKFAQAWAKRNVPA